jgi:hypothetical protein
MSSHAVSEASRPKTRKRAGAGIYVALVPWVLFSLITQHDTLKAAAVVALVAATAIAAVSVLRGSPKALELGAVLAFAAFTGAAFSVGPDAAAWIARYARAIAAGELAAIAFGSLLVTPFTEQYARQLVPRKLWRSARFTEINRRLTTMWAWVFLAMVPCHIIAGELDTRRANTIFNWVLPVVLIVWAAKRTPAASETPTGGENQ